MSDRDPTKRIPKSLGTDTKLVGRYTLTDVAVALFPGVVVILLTQVILPGTVTVAGYPLRALTLPLAGGAIAVGALFVYLTPAYTTSLQWVGAFLRFHRRPGQLGYEDATGVSGVERVHPRHDAIERSDGAFIGMVQVSPPRMALATPEEWTAKAEAFQDFVNTAIEFPIQLYATTQPFPAEEYLGHYESRLEDPDVKENPALQALIQDYMAWYEADLEQRQMTIRDHYVIVPVTPEDVQFEADSLRWKLARVPLLGLIIRAWLAPPEAVQRAAMFDLLDERLHRVETGLREIEGVRAHRVEAGEATRLVAAFWTGEQEVDRDWDRILRTRPIVGGRRDS